MKMITINPAWIIGVDDRVGSIEVGKDADLVIWDGYPLSSFGVPDKVLIDGDVYFDRALPGFGMPHYREGAVMGDQSSVVSLSRQLRSSAVGQLALPVFCPGCLLLPFASAQQQNTVVLRAGSSDRFAWGDRERRSGDGRRQDHCCWCGWIRSRFRKNAQVIDVTGMTVYPGLIDSESALGLTEISAESSTNDLIEISDEIMPHMHVYDAFHAESELIPVARINGITNAIVAPQSQDTLPGQDAFVQLDGKSANDMLLVRDIALPLNFTGEQRRNESWEKRKFPQTRMGMAAQLRQAFLDAQDYGDRWADYEKKKADTSDKAGMTRKARPLRPSTI